MKKISEKAIQKLLEYEDGASITLYVPTHRHPSPPHMQEDQTRYKNLVREGCEQLADFADNKIATNIREKLEAKLTDTTFWQSMTDSLAVFANEHDIKMYHLPLEIEERVYVGKTYDLAPLLVLREMNQPFYVLALAMHDPVLYKGDMYALNEIDIDLPTSVEDALNIDEMFANSNTIRGHEGSGGLSHAIGPHGQGDSNEAGTEERFKYFRIIDQKIQNHKEFDSRAPLVIAATESEAGDFMAHTQLSSVVDAFIHGNHAKDSLHDLHQKAYKIIQDEVLFKRTEGLIERYHEMTGANKSSANHADIEEAARSGRVDTLMVSMFDMTADGVTDNEREALKIRYGDEYEKNGVLSLIKTVVLNGGRIIGMRPELMPEKATVAAVYRY